MQVTQTDMFTENRSKYPDGFFHWLSKNQKVWIAFEAKALQMARTRRKRYSARTIVEVLRWHSDISDHTTLFKLSNNMTPGMARLWMEKHGDQFPRFFSLHGK